MTQRRIQQRLERATARGIRFTARWHEERRSSHAMRVTVGGGSRLATLRGLGATTMVEAAPESTRLGKRAEGEIYRRQGGESRETDLRREKGIMDTDMKGGYGGEPLLVVAPDTGTGWSSRDSATVKRQRGEVHDEPGRGAGEERTHEDASIWPQGGGRRTSVHDNHDCGSVGALQGGATDMNAQCGTTTTMVRN
ncbi:hypothetical protein SESBI_49092 [Sesbania bispinosa]|nr:hypothetical protein SESBI_49092 [Sesbania bispinosa]